jgi:hypothetical protein
LSTPYRRVRRRFGPASDFGRCSGIRRVRQYQTTQCSQTKGP